MDVSARKIKYPILKINLKNLNLKEKKPQAEKSILFVQK
jgi:hypothetical protein